MAAHPVDCLKYFLVASAMQPQDRVIVSRIP